MEKGAYPAFLGFDIAPASYDEARIHIIPVEMEKSVSYGSGTAAGPRAILEASLQLEAFDGSAVPGQAGMHTHKPLPCRSAAVEHDLDAIGAEVAGVLNKKGLPVILGGEHTVTLGALRPFAAGNKRVGVVQFDAHADLRESYGGNRFSHACVMRRVHEMGLPFVQIGVRSLCQEEDRFRRGHNIVCLDAEQIYRGGIPAAPLPDDFPEQIYITFDVDCFDAALMPATGTPEPGGFNWYQAMDLLGAVCRGRQLCGFDVVELAPIPALHGPDYTAAKLVYRLIGLAVSAEKQAGKQ